MLTSIFSSVFLFVLYFKLNSQIEKRLALFSFLALIIPVLLIAFNFVDEEGVVLKY